MVCVKGFCISRERVRKGKLRAAFTSPLRGYAHGGFLLALDFDDAGLVHGPDKYIRRVELPPLHAKIHAHGQLVVVVLKQLAESQKIQRQGVLGLVVVVKPSTTEM